MMCVKTVQKWLWFILTHMKISQSNTLHDNLMAQLIELGACLARLRIARRMPQSEAALRAGISRTTASQIEKGSPSVAIGQIVRYLDAVAPGKTIAQLLHENDPALLALAASERRKRARSLSPSELKALDF